EIKVKRGLASVPCVIPATVRATAKDETSLVVTAEFFHKGRLSGRARRSIPIEPVTAAPPTAPSPALLPATTGRAAIDTAAEPPSMTVSIHRWSDDGTFKWMLVLSRDARGTPGLPATLAGRSEPLGDPRAFLHAQLDKLADLPPGQHLRQFQGFGALLYKSAP